MTNETRIKKPEDPLQKLTFGTLNWVFQDSEFGPRISDFIRPSSGLLP